MNGQPEPRKPLTKRQRADMAIEQAGRCGCSALPELHPIYRDFPVCAGKLNPRSIDEHLWPLAAGGTNDRDNRALLNEPCARIKTDEYDAALIAKTKRQAGERGGQVERRARKKERGYGMKGPVFQTNRNSPWKAKIGGGVERRK
jgi:hypothetical protein